MGVGLGARKTATKFGCAVGARKVGAEVAFDLHLHVAIHHRVALLAARATVAPEQGPKAGQREGPGDAQRGTSCRVESTLKAGACWPGRCSCAKVSPPMKRAINFNAGPASLPLAALERAREELLDFEGTGMSIMEHSHRGKVYEKVHHEAASLVSELLGLPSDYVVLFVQGGASLGFAQIPLNFLPPGATADYLVTGAWGEKAVSEARAAKSLGAGEVHVAATTESDKTYRRVPRPEELRFSARPAYVHMTSNETIHGVAWGLDPSTAFPTPESPLVCDMSSDILGSRIDASQFAMIYAGAQKNIGPSGVTIVCARKAFIEQGRRDLPAILQFRTHADNQSLYNTPPTFGIYLVRNTLQWLKAEGGVDGIEKRNRQKAKSVYDAIDASGGFYRGPVEAASRSIMNVVFRLPSVKLEESFVEEAEKQGMVGLKGHRSVGGIRVSLYNAVDPAWVATLASFMRDFAARQG